MKQFFLMMSMLLVQSTVIAGNKITGMVIDDDDSSALIGATVVLYDENHQLITGVTTNSDGLFLIKEIKSGSYILQCSYVGYDNYTISLNPLNKQMDLGEIRMKSSSTTLGEVVVEGEMVVKKIDRQLIMPTENQRKASTNGVSLLQHLQLSGVIVNPMTKSIATSYGESVQLRINGVEATKEEVVAIHPTDVIRIEYHDQPSLRYGGAAAVIDYIVRKKDAGGHISADLTNGLSILGFGDYQISGKYHKGNSALSTVMSWNRRDLEWNRENEESFHYPNRVLHNQEVVASPNKVKYNYFNWALNYSHTYGEKSMLNIALRHNLKDIPHSFTDRNSILHQEDKTYQVTDREQTLSNIPSIDIYYQLNLKNNQHLYFDVVGTFLNSSTQRTFSMSEKGQTPTNVFSKTEGDKYSLIAEAIYERPLFKGKLTTGLKHIQATMNNIYDGDIRSKVSMSTAETSFFTEFQSKIKNLNYTFGIGTMRTHYKQGNSTQEKYIFRPTLNLSYQCGKIFLRYNASLSGYSPSLSALSDVVQKMDAYQVRRGNPNLKSVTYFTNRLSTSFRNKWMNIELSGRYSYDNKPIMEETHYEKGIFVHTYANQKGFHRLNLQANAQFRLFKKYISINLSPYFNRYISQGNTYTHTHNNWGFRGSIIGFYKRWTAMANIQTSYHDLWGETIKRGESIHSLAMGYNAGKWGLQAMIMNPFTNDYHQSVENVSKLTPNKQLAFSKDFTRMFMLNISFNLDFGKQKQERKKRIQNSDTDTGILSGSK